MTIRLRADPRSKLIGSSRYCCSQEPSSHRIYVRTNLLRILRNYLTKWNIYSNLLYDYKIVDKWIIYTFAIFLLKEIRIWKQFIWTFEKEPLNCRLYFWILSYLTFSFRISEVVSMIRLHSQVLFQLNLFYIFLWICSRIYTKLVWWVQKLIRYVN